MGWGRSIGLAFSRLFAIARLACLAYQVKRFVPASQPLSRMAGPRQTMINPIEADRDPTRYVTYSNREQD
jgi:hypothetical protein